MPELLPCSRVGGRLNTALRREYRTSTMISCRTPNRPRCTARAMEDNGEFEWHISTTLVATCSPSEDQIIVTNGRKYVPKWKEDPEWILQIMAKTCMDWELGEIELWDRPQGRGLSSLLDPEPTPKVCGVSPKKIRMMGIEVGEPLQTARRSSSSVVWVW